MMGRVVTLLKVWRCKEKLKYILTAGEHKQNFDIKVSY